MATFYGTVKGNRETAATRTGSRDSGIRASVQSYKGSVITTLTERKDDGALMVEVAVSEGSEAFFGKTIFCGTFEEYKEILSNAWNNKNNRPIKF